MFTISHIFTLAFLPHKPFNIKPFHTALSHPRHRLRFMVRYIKWFIRGVRKRNIETYPCTPTFIDLSTQCWVLLCTKGFTVVHTIVVLFYYFFYYLFSCLTTRKPIYFPFYLLSYETFFSPLFLPSPLLPLFLLLCPPHHKPTSTPLKPI